MKDSYGNQVLVVGELLECIECGSTEEGEVISSTDPIDNQYTCKACIARLDAEDAEDDEYEDYSDDDCDIVEYECECCGSVMYNRPLDGLCGMCRRHELGEEE